ncbi:MAG TPA: hypothetical protein VE935_23215 [Burkholderiales bacterium]|jgi:hypothetical protein|nr:hypothetical protein [Burkholderiales bacterium]
MTERGSGKLTVRFSESADLDFVDALAAICAVFGPTYWNHHARTLVVLARSARASRTLKAQLAQLVAENAPLTWA